VASASSAVALPLYLGKIGNFQVSADAIRGQDFELALAVDGNSGPAGGQLPVGEVTLGRAQIDGLLLEKEFDLSRVLGGPGGGTWKLSISTSGTTTATNLRINAAGICADSIAFGPGFAVDGKGAGTPNVSDDLSLGASTISLGKPGIEATYLTTRQILLAGIRIDVERQGYTLARCARAGR
jgi:hypothetical protein